MSCDIIIKTIISLILIVGFTIAMESYCAVYGQKKDVKPRKAKKDRKRVSDETE